MSRIGDWRKTLRHMSEPASTVVLMSPTSLDAQALNAEIRAFLRARRGRALTAAERRRYERLRAEWLAAVRRARRRTAA